MTKKFIIMTLSFLVVSCITLTGAHAVVYRPGLIQAKVSGDVTGKNQCSNYPSNLTSTVSAELLDRTLDTMMANFRAENADTYCLNPVSGKSWNWDNYITFAYEGEIWLESGVAYNMFEQGDDGSAVLVDGAIVTTAGATSRWESGTGATLTPTRTGWHRFNAFSWDWEGGKGPAAGCWGLCWNTNGVEQTSGTIAIDTPPWAIFADPGDMTFLKTATSESFMALNSVAGDGDDLVASMTFNVPTNATLYLLHGDENGGTLAVEDWDAQIAVASIAPGSLTTNVVVSGLDLESEPHVCFYLRSAPAVTGGQHVFEEWLTPFQLSGSPDATLAVDAFDYTTASFSATAVSMGLGGTSADLSVEIATDAGFASIIDTIAATNGILNVPCSVSGIVNTSALITNTTYYARARLENQNSAVGYSSAVPFTTLNPGIPVVSGVSAGIGFDFGRFAGSLSAYGAGSTNALLYVDVSTTDDFAAYTAFGGSNVVGQLPAGRGLVATGLDNGTDYYARVRAVNTWGLAGVSTTIPFTTRLNPWAASPIGATAVSGGTRLSMSIIELVAGATVDATLAIGTTAENAAQVQSWNGVSAAPSVLTYVDGASSGTYVAQYIVTSTYGGEFYAATNTLAFTVGLNVYVAPTLGDLVTLQPKVGESVQLPALLAPQDFYRVLNTYVAATNASGHTVMTLRPGATGIEAWTVGVNGTNELTRVGHLIVVPDRIKSGNIWKLVEGKEQANDPTSWICISDPSLTGVSYPNGSDEIVFAILTGEADRSLRFAVDTTYGELFVGQFENKRSRLYIRGNNGPRLVFNRTDKQPGALHLTGGGLGGTIFFVHAENGMIFDAGPHGLELDFGHPLDAVDESHRENNRQRIYVDWNKNVEFHIPAGSFIRYVNASLRWNPEGDSQDGCVWFYLGSGNKITGSGDFIHDSIGTLTLWANLNDFTGTLVSRAHADVKKEVVGDRQGMFFIRTGSLTNCAMRLEGYGAANAQYSPGNIGWGNRHGYGSTSYFKGNNLLPGRSVTSLGGCLYSQTEANAWGEGTIQELKTQVFDAEAGLTHIVGTSYRTEATCPTNVIHFVEARNSRKGTMHINDYRIFSGNPDQRGRIYVDNWSDVAIGAAASGSDDGVFPIIPWMAIATGWSASRQQFATFKNDNDIVLRSLKQVSNLSCGVSEFANVYDYYGSTALSADTTFNSLLVLNDGKGATWTCLGAGRKLTLTSGALSFWNNDSKIGQQDQYAAVDNPCGILNFPNTAYVYSSAAESDPNEIWASIVAPQGFVNGLYGALLLGGDQTGIDDEIVINSGTLILGSLDGTVPAVVDVPVRVVGGNSKLRITAGDPLKDLNVFIEDVGGYPAKVQGVPGATTRVNKLYIDGVTLSRGTWGATGSGADFIDDEHFVGTGVVMVRRDDILTPSVMLIR